LSDKPSPRFHGRIPGDRPCSWPGCPNVGEFRVPGATSAGFDGPGAYRWMCLDHVREFNAAYNFFDGMSAEEIMAAQSPYGGWERETRAFAATGADLPPTWANFRDPMDALGARFRAAKQKAEDSAAGIDPADRAALTTLGLEPGVDGRAVRKAYTALARAYHPDRNGGDRSHEAKLQAVVAAYQRLRRRVAR
jgi:hypothetical protein